jgi:hypothetical protein
MQKNIVILILVIALSISIGVNLNQLGTNEKLGSTVSYFETTYLRQQGYTSFNDYGNYELMSFDGGLNWYAVERVNAEVKILGLAEDLYPGLTGYIQGMDALIDYVEKNGPIGSSPITSEDLKVLEGAGFSVEQK